MTAILSERAYWYPALSLELKLPLASFEVRVKVRFRVRVRVRVRVRLRVRLGLAYFGTRALVGAEAAPRKLRGLSLPNTDPMTLTLTHNLSDPMPIPITNPNTDPGLALTLTLANLTPYTNSNKPGLAAANGQVALTRGGGGAAAELG